MDGPARSAHRAIFLVAHARAGCYPAVMAIGPAPIVTLLAQDYVVKGLKT